MAQPRSALRALAKGTALRDALIAASARQALPLLLQSGERVQAAGEVCASIAAGERVWEFPPAAAGAASVVRHK